MQPTQNAIERELEALRDIRRRSTAQGGPGALILDPDLPAEQPTTTPPLSPQAWAAVDQMSSGKDADSASTSSSSAEGNNQAADDPFHLFWVPAHLHPELAPKEFKAFLKEHARGPVDGTSAVLLGRSSSSSSSGLDRKRSMLSRQYKPREEDEDKEDHVVPMRRSRSIYGGQDGPQLTISDLQKLEELADEASKSDDPSKLRRVIRRSLSLNVAPSFLDSMDDAPDSGDDADSPIIVPKPNQGLRRAARTKIRKPGLAGDGGGHRFPATRRKSGRAATIDAHTSQERSSGEISDFDPHRRPRPPSHKTDEDTEESLDQRRMTFTEESLIYDAYADSSDDHDVRHSRSPPPQTMERSASPPPPVPPIPPVPPLPSQIPSQPPILHQPQPQRQITPVLQTQTPELTRSPSPEPPSSTPATMEDPHKFEQRIPEPPSVLSPSPAAASEKRKEKDKKSGGILKKWGSGGDKTSKKNGKEKDRDKDKDKDKESGFFGSLFGKKKQEEPTSNLGNGAGPATAAALLGASRTNRGIQPSISPQLGNPYARYPIHVERAVYRLSHIKLANPRRPLYEQVLISNLMFWYLGVINKQQQAATANGTANNGNQAQIQSQQQQQQQQPQQQPQLQSNSQATNGGNNGQQTASEPVQHQEHAPEQTQEQERERSPPEPKREARRGSLTKSPQPGSSAAAGRRAEMPVKGPQYGLQHQVIEQEYGPGPPTVGGSTGRGNSTQSGGSQSGYSPNRGGYPSRGNSRQGGQTQQQMYSQPDGNSNFYYGRPSADGREPNARSPSPGRSGSQNLPPGAMPAPTPGEQTWYTSPPRGSSSQRSPHSSSANNDYSSSDWMQEWSAAASFIGGGDNSPLSSGKPPSRSLSANAAVPINNVQQSTNLRKKMASATAVDPNRRPRSSDGNEEEDVPLAVWQQQRRR